MQAGWNASEDAPEGEQGLTLTPAQDEGPVRVEKAAADSFGRILALALLSNPGAVVGVVSPAVVNAFVARGSDIAVAGHFAVAELFASAAMILAASLFVNRIDRRILGLAAIAAAVTGQLLSVMTGAVGLIETYRACAGAGEGLLYAVAIASLSRTAAPDRALGVSVASNQVASTLLLILMAWLGRGGHATAAVWVIAAFIALHLPFVPSLPARVKAESNSAGARAGVVNRLPVFYAIAGMILLAAGFGAVWPLIGQIGAARGIPAVTIAVGFSIVGLGGIAGGSSAAAFGARLGRSTAITLGTLGMAACILLSLSLLFVAAMFFIMFFFVFSLPFYLALLSGLDRTGRLSVLTSAMIPFGIAAGQTIAGLLAGYGLASVVYAGCAASIAALAVVRINKLHTVSTEPCI
jgi:DHA1 family inner membrane transport protein